LYVIIGHGCGVWGIDGEEEVEVKVEAEAKGDEREDEVYL
jgi:hypothetical protein